MTLRSMSERLVDLERITSADIFNAPAERVIAQGRLLLCALATLAIQFAPTQPTQYAAAAELILWVYFAFAALMGVLFIVWITRVATTADNDLETAIIRGAYLIAAGGMLAYVSTFYRRSRE